MPIYEYLCSDCGKPNELIVRSDTEISCEHCGSNKLKRKLSLFAAHTGSATPEACAGGCAGGMARGECGSGMCSPGGR